MGKYERALGIREKILQENHPDLGITLNNTSEVYYNDEKYVEAQSYFERGLTIRQLSLPSAHPDIRASLESIEAVKQNMQTVSSFNNMDSNAANGLNQ